MKREARGSGGIRGKTQTDHEEATYDDRCSKDGKVEEHPLEPVRSLGACLLRPDEARQEPSLVLAHTRNFILSASLKEIQSNDFDSEDNNRYTYVSDFILKFDI